MIDKNVFKKLTSGLYIVSSNYDNKLVGCVVNTVTQITSENPVIAVSINKNNYTNEIIKKSRKVAISILSLDISKEIINTFGFKSSKDTNKFLNISFEIVDNLPVLKEDICGYIIGEVINIIDVETHDIFLIRVNKTYNYENKIPLTYDYYKENMKGATSKNAPSYIEDKIKSTKGKVYRCVLCGHLYIDDNENTRFEDLPDDWVCPKCGASKDKFELVN